MIQLQDAAAWLAKAVREQMLDAARFIIWDADQERATFEGTKWSSGAVTIRELPEGWPFNAMSMPDLQPPEFLIWLDTATSAGPWPEVTREMLAANWQPVRLPDDVQDHLATVLMNAGATDECENPESELGWVVMTPKGKLVIGVYIDGGDAFEPGALFYRALVNEAGDLLADEVHVPGDRNLQDQLVDKTQRGAYDALEQYLLGIVNDPSQWRALSEAVQRWPNPMEPKCIFDEED